MAIPTASNYPTNFDTDTNLYVVHDGLRLLLAEDYTLGDTSITIYTDTDEDVMGKFPDSGIITLTEQYSDIDDRAVTFYYASRTESTFDELELFPEFTDVPKSKDYTNVTLNVTAPHHNNLKDALIAVETFLGTRGTIDTKAFGDTLTGRLNFLAKLILTPRAWFKADRTIGIVPLDITFTDQSFRLGDGAVTYMWNFGDQTSSMISTISVISVVPFGETEVIVEDLDGGTITKTYTEPGKYDVKLTVVNEYGEDTIIFEEMINARIHAPYEAQISVTIGSQQAMIGDPGDERLRARVNTPIAIEVPEGVDDSIPLLDPVRSYAGEELTDVVYSGGIPVSGTPIDPITNYTWNIADDLTHPNSKTTKAMFTAGGLYDIILRTDTYLDAFRLTTNQEALDIIEEQNMWLWTFPTPVTAPTSDLERTAASGTITAREFGLLSETFKTGMTQYSVSRDETFLDGTNNEEQAKREFRRNTGFTNRTTTGSGAQGTAVMYWAQGNAAYTLQEVIMAEYSGFYDTYTVPLAPSSLPLTITRPWNWVNFNTGQRSYFLFGADPTSGTVPNENKSNQTVDIYTLFDPVNPLSSWTLTTANYENGAEELLEHPTNLWDGSSEPDNGYFAVYRACWKDQTGYLTRNIAPGSSDPALNYFRIENFYKTNSTATEEISGFTKLTNMPGTVKQEGELVSLMSGVFFFDNSGSISAYNTSSEIWEVGGPSSNSVTFRSLQDASVTGFDSRSRTLLAASDNAYTAYLSYDYSTSVFIKFNSQDLTYLSMGARPEGLQFMLSVY